MMRSVDSSRTAQLLLGDLVEVTKMSPGVSDVHVPAPLTPVRIKRKRVAKRQLTPQEKAKRQEMERKVAQVSNVVGLGAGTLGTASAVGAYKDTKRTGATGPVTGAVSRRLKISDKATRRLGVIGAGGALGLQAGNVVGDVVTARVLGRSKVDKGIPIPKLVTARVTSMKRVLGLNKKTKAPGVYTNPNPTAPTPGKPIGTIPSNATGPLTPDAQKAMQTGAERRKKVEEFMSSTAGKATAGVGGAALIYGQGKKKGAEQASYGVYKRHDVEIGGTFSKFDEDKKRAYGWASVVTMDGEPVVDRQGDYIGLEDIEEAAYTYVRKSRVAGDMHRRTAGEDGTDAPHKAGELIESVVFTPDKCHAMGLPASFAGKWWMGVQVEDDEVWQEVKKGNRTGFSIHGKGLRKETTLDDIKAGR